MNALILTALRAAIGEARFIGLELKLLFTNRTHFQGKGHQERIVQKGVVRTGEPARVPLLQSALNERSQTEARLGTTFCQHRELLQVCDPIAEESKQECSAEEDKFLPREIAIATCRHLRQQAGAQGETAEEATDVRRVIDTRT